MNETENVRTHFADRAGTYDRSSAWCTDDALGGLMLSAAASRPDHAVLDVACGTGLVSRLFAGRVRRLTGVDITPEMAERARDVLDELVIAPAEELPFADGAFDLVVCRQGIQFMTLPDAVREMVRVTRPGGRVVLTHLCAYGDDDRDEYAEILRLRNPARRHFFRAGDVEALLAGAGCAPVRSQRHVSVEDVDVWSDNGAIGEDAREAIRDRYRRASPAFRARHAVAEADGRITDRMLFVVASGTRV
ncbi:methyltransferase domain-containing protein [Streptomyces sp. SID4928]|uniref:class I SAM-dependent methyltransferase n=1 Tax=unclassified Streptomyces TaxID=2593676 RepID=UPI0001C19175|nr:class I SAM-dependent methyltransferase [Streptomyces sp. ACT-1]EGE40392.1 Methyltransferase type 11 [Streptomyces sp. ACT-1]MYR48475.1 methyltransferase domain-containing protein [Streptomyces sp. SID4928]